MSKEATLESSLAPQRMRGRGRCRYPCCHHGGDGGDHQINNGGDGDGGDHQSNGDVDDGDCCDEDDGDLPAAHSHNKRHLL